MICCSAQNKDLKDNANLLLITKESDIEFQTELDSSSILRKVRCVFFILFTNP